MRPGHESTLAPSTTIFPNNIPLYYSNLRVFWQSVFNLQSRQTNTLLLITQYIAKSVQIQLNFILWKFLYGQHKQKFNLELISSTILIFWLGVVRNKRFSNTLKNIYFRMIHFAQLRQVFLINLKR